MKASTNEQILKVSSQIHEWKTKHDELVKKY